MMHQSRSGPSSDSSSSRTHRHSAYAIPETMQSTAANASQDDVKSHSICGVLKLKSVMRSALRASVPGASFACGWRRHQVVCPRSQSLRLRPSSPWPLLRNQNAPPHEPCSAASFFREAGKQRGPIFELGIAVAVQQRRALQLGRSSHSPCCPPTQFVNTSSGFRTLDLFPDNDGRYRGPRTASGRFWNARFHKGRPGHSASAQLANP